MENTTLRVANSILAVTCHAEFDADGNDIPHGDGYACGRVIDVPVGVRYEYDGEGRRRMRVTVPPVVPSRCPAGHTWHEDDVHDIHNQIDNALLAMAG